MGTRIAIVAVLCVLPTPHALAQGTITDGPATFALAGTPFDTTPAANFTGVSPILTQDHLFETGWWYRLQGAAAEKFFPVPTAQNYAGNTATLSWTNVDGQGFNAQLVYTIVNTGGPSGYVTGQLDIMNPGNSGLSIDIFNFVDYDVQPVIGDDSAILITPNNHIRITDPGGNFAVYRGLGANAFLVRPFGATDVAAELSDAGVDNFDNSGLPFAPADFTGGFQWTKAVIPAGGEKCYTLIMAVNTPPPVPCPEDTNADCDVNVADLINVILDWGTNGAANGGDVDGNGTVNVTDMVQVVVNWGPC